MKQITPQKSFEFIHKSHQLNFSTKKIVNRNKRSSLIPYSKQPMNSTKTFLTSACTSIKLPLFDLSFVPILKLYYDQIPQHDITESEESMFISFIQNSIIEKDKGKYIINTNELIKLKPSLSIIDEAPLTTSKVEDLCNSSRYLLTSATTKSYTSSKLSKPKRIIKKEVILNHNRNINDTQRQSIKIKKIQIPSTLSSRNSISPRIKSEQLRTFESNIACKKKPNKQIDALIEKFFKEKGFKL